MALTDYHARYLALELTRRTPTDSDDRMATSVATATVDLNPQRFASDSERQLAAILEREAEKWFTAGPRRYALIPHDAIAENMTIAGLVKRFGG